MDINIRPNLPWIIPMIFTLIFGGYQVWSLIDRVASLEKERRITTQRIYNIEHRIDRVEEFCCSEIKTCQ